MTLPLNEEIIRFLGSQIDTLSDKVDDYHETVKEELSELKQENATQAKELRVERARVDTLQVEQKVLRVWGLVALLAGSAGGAYFANLVPWG
jgi:hypothetical protein